MMAFRFKGVQVGVRGSSGSLDGFRTGLGIREMSAFSVKILTEPRDLLAESSVGSSSKQKKRRWMLCQRVL